MAYKHENKINVIKLKLKYQKDTSENLSWFLTLAIKSPDKYICKSEPT